MQSATQAYGAVARQIAHPRELEADLLLSAASRLQAVKDGWDGSTRKLDDALLYNHKLWTIFLASVTGSENPLPTEIRQNVANLGLFVMKQTLSTLADPRHEQLNSLISINCEIAAGLLGRA
jgi:flagellar biosynthesis activator protein FlaF